MALTHKRNTSHPALEPDDPRVARPVFTLREAAGYLAVPTSTLHAWARPAGGGAPLITSQTTPG
jgi:hypothetical protein